MDSYSKKLEKAQRAALLQHQEEIELLAKYVVHKAKVRDSYFLMFASALLLAASGIGIGILPSFRDNSTDIEIASRVLPPQGIEA